MVFDYDADDLLTTTHQPWGDPIAEDEWEGQNGRRYVQELERDERGRITRITPSYDPDDPQETAQIGRRRTRYTHFQNGWIKTAIDPDYAGDGDDTVKRLRYGYDRRGHQTSWRFERQEGTAEPILTREVTRAFAPNGTLTTREARRPGRAPRIYAYAYNANHSLVSISDGDVGGDDHGSTRVTEIKVNAAEQPVLDADRPASVYNITVAGLHTYFAGDRLVLVHNAKRECEILYHYTDEAGEQGILQSGKLNPSTGPVRARHGSGQYLTDIAPESGLNHWQLARRLFAAPVRGGRSLDRCIRIRTCGLKLENPAPNTFRVPGDEPLDLTGRIVGSGPGVPRPR